MPSQLEIIRSRDLLVGHIEPAELVKALDSFLGVSPPVEKLTEAAVALGHPDILLPLIDARLREPSGIESGIDFPHVIVRFDNDGQRVESFHAIPLARGVEDSWNARLHVWFPEQGGEITRDVHTHAQPFGSTVLTGQFTDEVWRTSRYQEGERMHVYDDNQQPEPNREVTLKPGEARVIRAGQNHTMPPSLIHNATIDPREGMVTTLVVRGRPIRSSGAMFTSGLRNGSSPWREQVDPVEDLHRIRRAVKFGKG